MSKLTHTIVLRVDDAIAAGLDAYAQRLELSDPESGGTVSEAARDLLRRGLREVQTPETP
jgi:hypothetical protein